MRTSIETLRADVERSLRANTLQTAAICLGATVLALRVASGDALPLYDDTRASSFVSGVVSGLLAVAIVISVRRIVDLRRALSSETELRRYLAREHDELRAHMEREMAQRFVQVLPALFVVTIVVAAFVSVEAMVAAAATEVFLALAFLAVKVACKRRYREEGAE